MIIHALASSCLKLNSHGISETYEQLYISDLIVLFVGYIFSLLSLAHRLSRDIISL